MMPELVVDLAHRWKSPLNRWRVALAGLLIALNAPILAAEEPVTAPEAPAAAATPPAADIPIASAAPAPGMSSEIDALVEGAQLVPAAVAASDAEFIRRVSLDLNGCTPTTAEVRAFLADTTADKRTILVDRLLARPEFVRHLAQLLDVMLMERRPDKQVPTPEWQAYLYASVKANKPFDQLAREILGAETEQTPDPALRPAAKFYLDRDAEANLLTRDVARIFFGKDFQCNQCHDHPLVGDYLQSDYYGLFACLQRTSLFTDKEKKVSLAEKADGEPTFQSVFVPDDKPHTAAPQLPDGSPLAEPAVAKGEEYLVAPAENVRHVPRQSRRALLARYATDGANPAFARNIANRLWAHMLGRGLVEPVDLHHGDNPPTNPELLDLLAKKIVDLKFDLKEFLRQVALSNTYQRSIDLPAQLRERTNDVATRMPELEKDAADKSTALEAARLANQQAESALASVRTATESPFAELAKAQAAVAEAQKVIDAASAALNAAQADLTAKTDVANALTSAATAAQAAAAKLPKEPELAQAAEKFRLRAEQTTAEVTAATTLVTQRQTEFATASATMAPLQTALQAASAAVAPGQKQRDEAEAVVVSSTASLRHARLLAQVAAGRLSDARALLAYRDALARFDTAQAEADRIAAEVATAVQPVAQRIAEASTQRAQAEAAVATADQTAAGMTTALAAAEQQFSEKQGAKESVAEALAKATAARDKLPDDAELAQAVTLLTTGAERAAVGLAAVEKQRNDEQQRLAEAQTQQQAARQALDARSAEVTSLEAERAKIQAPAEQSLAAAQAERQGAIAAEQVVVDRLQPRLTISAIKQLSPAALAWSMLQASGVLEANQAAVAAEWLTAHPGVDVAQLDATQRAAREFELERALFEKLKGVPQQFVSLFAAPPGQPQNTFQATVDQALFLANNGTLKSWLTPAGRNLTARLMALNDPQQFSEELYLSVLNRQPTAEETAETAALLAARPDERQAIVMELAWGLICSSEFRFNH